MATRVSPPDSKGDLGRLLETEQRLEDVVTRARAEAERIVAHAREEVAARAAAVAAELEAGVRQVESAIAAERSRREAEIVSALRQDATRFESVSEERVRELARYVIGRVIGGASS